MEFRILGPLEVRDGREHVALRGPKQRGLLAVLLLSANRVVALERLVDELWEDPPSTAPKAVQVYVAKLRKLFADARSDTPRLVTRTPGYVLEIEPTMLDLHRFESLVESGRHALERGDAQQAAEQLSDALRLWRGPPLDGFVDEPFARPARARLEELQLAAIEWANEAELALGHHAQLVGDLQRLTAEHPLRERLRGQLMRALYGSGRQAEALDVYQKTRALLVDELGLEPGQALQQLERAILVQDPSLEPSPVEPPAAPAADAAAGRAVLVVALDQQPLDPLLWLARPLAEAEPRHELIVIRLVGSADHEPRTLSDAAAELDAVRTELAAAGVTARAAAFTSAEFGDDLLRLASDREVDLLLLDGTQVAGEGLLPPAPVLERSVSDVGLVLHRSGQPLRLDGEHPPVVVFGGAECDWAALELGAWLARGAGTSLRLLGTAADAVRGRRDASRLLANASLVVQKFAGVYAEPLLATGGSEGILASARDAGAVLIGVDGRDGVRFGGGHVRIAREATAPVVFVSRGLRPSGLAPQGLTRFTWSLAGEDAGAANQ